ncbi:MAG: flagellar rod assembly protein/muramidase FlgJ [Gallionellales bacterium RBG_16_56_9]|nr:MAG: flagellar rod assembly protein/muramidase FlgJ [Gallionellales bacterium RBG_16_56_9]
MISRLDTAATLALDTQGLEQLRAQARQSPDQALKAAAQQFEAVFLNMMLKSMREATPQDGIFDSEQTRMFTGMLDQQLTQSMASRGVGLADIMVQQLSRSNGAESTLSANSAPSSKGNNIQQDFISRLLPHATQASQASGVPVQLMLGQAALESGWGKREIRMADGSNSYNLFGIKADAGWHGKTAEVMTTEYENGVAHQQSEKFRAYSSYAGAFQDYADLISNNPRYAEVLQQGSDAAGMAQALQKAGYATDPQYADKLVRVLGIAGDLLSRDDKML